MNYKLMNYKLCSYTGNVVTEILGERHGDAEILGKRRRVAESWSFWVKDTETRSHGDFG